jgi:hypothetical protein
MKNLFKVFGIIALVAVIGFSFAACGDGGGGGSGGGGNPQTATYTGTSDGTVYTLKITEKTARYAAQNGDAYELSGGSKKSTGTVDNITGGVLTLKPSNAATTFTATVSGNSLTALSGTITWTNNTTASAPGTLTGGTTPGTGSGGTLTVTDIPAKYNGKHAMFIDNKNLGEDIRVVGSNSIGSNAIYTFTRISNGRVSIPAWLINNNEQTLVRYSGNDTLDIVFSIYNVSTFDEVTDDILGNTLATGTFMSVKFSNGSAAKSRNDATNWIETK